MVSFFAGMLSMLSPSADLPAARIEPRSGFLQLAASRCQAIAERRGTLYAAHSGASIRPAARRCSDVSRRVYIPLKLSLTRQNLPWRIVQSRTEVGEKKLLKELLLGPLPAT